MILTLTPLLVPVEVGARVVTQATTAPARKSGASGAALARGVHLHWALPDFLTRARVEAESSRVLFPSVPDLWLVVRFNPLPTVHPTGHSPGGVLVRRHWRGWIVESRFARVVPLSDWTLPQDYASSQVLTAQGVLPASTVAGESAWGVLPPDHAADPAAAAYYPDCQNRFGFCDPLDDGVATGRVSYLVYGFYCSSAQDPYATTSDPVLQRARWKLALPAAQHARTVSPALGQSEIGDFEPAFEVTAHPDPSAAARSDRTRRHAPSKLNVARALSTLAGAIVLGNDRPPPTFPVHGSLACHGAVLGVSVDGSASARRAADHNVAKWSARLLPSLAEAVAGVGSSQISASDQEEWSAALLTLIHDFDQSLYTLGGEVALPNRLQRLGFQSCAGAPTLYGQLELAVPHSTSTPPKPSPSTPTPVDWAGILGRELAALATRNSGLHPYLIRVNDHRAAKQVVGVTSLPNAPTGASYWLDIRDPVAIADLRQRALGVASALPTQTGLFKLPGPRWYRPYSPVLVLSNAGRSFRHGFDGRFNADDSLGARLAHQTVTTINASTLPITIGNRTKDGFPSGSPVRGAMLLDSPERLGTQLPPEVRNLLEEVLLLDEDNAASIAGCWLNQYVAANPKLPAPELPALIEAFKDQIDLQYSLRDPDHDDSDRTAREASLCFGGIAPSPIAFIPWEPPWEPLFANVCYTFQPFGVGSLGPVDLALAAPSGAPIRVQEAPLIAPHVTRILESAMMTRATRGFYGAPIPFNPPVPLRTDTFTRLDVLSATLTGLDAALAHDKPASRAGRLTLESVSVVDAFGSVETLAIPPPVSTAATATQIDLAPRWPDWSRLLFRFMSAIELDREADLGETPVCGYLLPDPIEHALEIYDSNGVALGQLVSAPPILLDLKDRASTEQIPSVRFEPHPLRPDAPITNPFLKSFVDGVLRAERREQDASQVIQDGRLERYCESALSAMLRTIDTLRTFVDPQAKSVDHRVRLVGSPIALVRARAWVESSTGSTPGAGPLRGNETPLQLKVGHATQANDGVLGVFHPASSPDGGDARYLPTDVSALDALLAADTGQLTSQPVVHSFVRDSVDHPSDTTFTLAPGDKRDLLLLLDVRAGVVVTTGVLPQKSISLPTEFFHGAYKTLAPTLRVGPLLTGQDDDILLPSPHIAGYESKWLETGSRTALAIPKLPSDGTLPTRPAKLSDGFIVLEPLDR